MASADEAMGGSSSDPLSLDDEEPQRTDAGSDKDDNEDSSSISSEDSFESDLESESFTDVTPLHSISNSPLPTQPIGSVAGVKVRDSIGHTDADRRADDSSASSSEDENLRPRSHRRNRSGEGRSCSKTSRVSARRPTVKRAPIRANLLGQGGNSSLESGQIRTNGTEVGLLTDAIQKLGLRGSGPNNNEPTTTIRSRRQREHDRRLEAENEQLLKRIIAQQSRVAELVSSSGGGFPRQHVASSAVNRKRQQKYIHTQNLALHKRIEAARNGTSSTSNGSPLAATSSRKSVRVPPSTAPAQFSVRQRRDSR